MASDAILVQVAVLALGESEVDGRHPEVLLDEPVETEWEEAEEASDVMVRLAEPVLTPSR